ncbi:MAG: hypothetical protein WBB38_13570 [Hyphomicrobiaceae bacterium]|jgi:hypothetical protein
MSRVEVAAGGLDQICGTFSARAKQVALACPEEGLASVLCLVREWRAKADEDENWCVSLIT